MNYGVPKEIRDLENRVGLTPAGVNALVQAGHEVFVQNHLGEGAGFSDENYRSMGATVVYSAEEAYGRADVIAKVTRLTSAEYAFLRQGQTILSFTHLAVASLDLKSALQQREITSIAYEMIQAEDGSLPVLQTSSDVAGRLAPVIAGELLASTRGGRGILLSGVPGVPAAAVVILGAGILGTSAARSFVGLGAQVTVLDREASKLQRIDELFQGRVTTLYATPYNIRRVLEFADVLVGAVLMPGQRTPIVVTREMLKCMRPRSLVMDFSIDQGGCFETSRPTTHRDPTFVEEGVIHYCVPNILSRVARTASHALLNASLPYLYNIGLYGVDEAIRKDLSLARGVSVWHGKPEKIEMARALGLDMQLGHES
jgi:alanine dehydrogenase